MSPVTTILIGQPETCRRLERQLDLLGDRPVVIGWILSDESEADQDDPVLGTLADLEPILARRQPAMALLSFPAAMGDLVREIRTRLRRLGVPDRFMPTLEDQLAGIGPRSEMTVDVGELLGRPRREIDEAAVSQLLRDQCVLITGAGGSIGSEICRIVASFDPSRLVMVERSENALFEIDRQIARFFPDLPRKALLHDIVEREATLERFQQLRPDIIFHAAAHKHVPMLEDQPGAAIDNNLFGTKSVADAAAAVGAGRFVMISTDKAVNPSSIMGATKRLAEMYIQSMNQRARTAFSMVRFGNVLGSSGSVLDIWARQIAEGGPLTITDPRMSRYFMTIPEAAALVIQSAALVEPSQEEAEVFVLDMGEPVLILDMAERFVRAHGLVPAFDDTEAEPGAGTIRIVTTGARPGEKLHEELARDVEALGPTRHADIQIWALPQPQPQDIVEMLTLLASNRRGRNPNKVAELVRSLVPEMVQPVAA